jgi:hypothetical protein
MLRTYAFVLCLAVCESAALAQVCINHGSVSGDILRYRICNVPDIDQRRADNGIVAGLPNEGKMYCIPTSGMNWLAYIANHGYPQYFPGPGNWGPEPYPAEPHYHKMTSALKLLGFMMSTDQNDGTYLGPAKSALEVVLNPFLFVVSGYETTASYSPRFSILAHAAVDGSLIMPGVGWYVNWVDLPQQIKDFLASHGFPTSGYFRNGGHMMSLVSAAINGSAAYIGVHDPATDKRNLVQQSSLEMKTYAVQAVTDHFDFDSRTQDRLIGLGSNQGFLDYYIAIRPLVALTSDGSLIKPIKATSTFQAIDLAGLPGAGGGGFVAAGTVTDLAVHPERVRHPYLVQNGDTIWEIDTLTGSPAALLLCPVRARLYSADRTSVCTCSRNAGSSRSIWMAGPPHRLPWTIPWQRLRTTQNRIG